MVERLRGGALKFIKNYNKTAIIYNDINISYEELIRNSKNFSSILEIEKGDRVVISMENRPEYLYSFLGVWDKKGINVCLDATFTAEEYVYYIQDCTPKYIITSKNNSENIEKAIKLANSQARIIIVDEMTERKKDEECEFLLAPEQNDTALILYTSGTTGEPKGVMLSFDNILVNIEGLDKYNMFIQDDVVLALLPMHHIFPLLGTGVVPLYKGATIVFLKDLSSQAMLDALKKYRVTLMIGVPRLWEMLHKKIMEKINSNRITKGIFKLSEKINNISFSKKIFNKVHQNFGGNIRFFVSGGSKLDAQIVKDFYTLGIKMCEGYGMTETAPMISFTPLNDIVPGCAGKILPGVTVKISDDGEILAKGRNVMLGYYNKEKATKEMIDEDGWLSTGDLGELKGEYLYVTGRKKEMIVLSNGKNINPVEIEQWIMSKCDFIQEVAIIELDGILTAVIYPNFQKIVENEIANIKETIKWGVIDKFNNSAPAYKKILDVKIIQEEIPKTKLGKFRRFMIKDLLKNQENKDIVINEPEFEEYHEIKKYLENLKNKKIIPTSHLELDLGMDSLDIVEFFSFVEGNYGTKIDENILINNSTVEKIALYISENRGEKGNIGDWKEFLTKDADISFSKSNYLISVVRVLTWLPFKFYIKIKSIGNEKIEDKPAIFVGNHQSFLDAFILGHTLPKNILNKTYSMAKIKHFDNKFMRYVANNSNVILVDINKNLSEMLQITAKVLREGNNVVIFPEGIRSRDGKMSEFKKSFAILAKELDIPVVPFGIKGAYEAFPTNAKFPKPTKVEIKYFEKIEPSGKTYDEIITEVRGVISEWVEK